MKKSITLRSAKIKITKLKHLLWKCYSHLQECYGVEDDDFLTGSMITMDFVGLKQTGTELKRKIRKVFERR